MQKSKVGKNNKQSLPVLNGGSVAVAIAAVIPARVMVGVLRPLLARILGALMGSGGGGAQKLGSS